MDGFALSLFFFFSSRRRHTRFKCDWSSDVCSSDLIAASASWSAPFMSFLMCTMPIQSPLCGPKAPTKSWPASPASPSARQMPKLHNLCHEPLLQDTSHEIAGRQQVAESLHGRDQVLYAGDGVSKFLFVLVWSSNPIRSGLHPFQFLVQADIKAVTVRLTRHSRTVVYASVLCTPQDAKGFVERLDF